MIIVHINDTNLISATIKISTKIKVVKNDNAIVNIHSC